MECLVAGRQSLLERQALFLIGARLGRCRIGDGVQVFLMKAGLFGELLSIAPVLHLSMCQPRHRPSTPKPAPAELSASAPQSSGHILEEDVVTELQRLLGALRSDRGFRHGGRVVVRGTAGGIPDTHHQR
jgi:hypothetical protein